MGSPPPTKARSTRDRQGQDRHRTLRGDPRSVCGLRHRHGLQGSGRCYTFEQNVPKERENRSFLIPGYAQEGNHPAVCVSWNDAKAYVDWLSKTTGKAYRLPRKPNMNMPPGPARPSAMPTPTIPPIYAALPMAPTRPPGSPVCRTMLPI